MKKPFQEETRLFSFKETRNRRRGHKIVSRSLLHPDYNLRSEGQSSQRRKKGGAPVPRESDIIKNAQIKKNKIKTNKIK
jgi:hypothetical protein